MGPSPGGPPTVTCESIPRGMGLVVVGPSLPEEPEACTWVLDSDPWCTWCAEELSVVAPSPDSSAPPPRRRTSGARPPSSELGVWRPDGVPYLIVRLWLPDGVPLPACMRTEAFTPSTLGVASPAVEGWELFPRGSPRRWGPFFRRRLALLLFMLVMIACDQIK